MTGPVERSIEFALRNRASTPTTTSNLPTPANDGNSTSVAIENDDGESNPLLSVSLAIRKKRRVHVVTNSERYAATAWMIADAEEHGVRHIISRTVRQFPNLFKGNDKANLAKASLWWRKRGTTMALKVAGTRRGNFVGSTRGGLKRASFKTAKGRGRKRSAWATALYKDLRAEFERLRAVGVKFSSGVLQTCALSLIASASEGCPYHSDGSFTFFPLSLARLLYDGFNILWKQTR